MLLTIYHWIDSEKWSQSDNSIRDRVLVDLFRHYYDCYDVTINETFPEIL